MDFSAVSDEELLKPDATADFGSMNDEELLKPDVPQDLGQVSDEELLKPDVPQDLGQVSDEELLKPDVPKDLSQISDEELLKPDSADAPELGMFERMGLEKQAQTGKESSWLDFLPVVGGLRQAEQNRQEAMEQKLYSGEYRDTLEASRYALSLGIPQEEVRRINGLGDEDAVRKGFSDAVKERFASRIQARETAQQKLDEAQPAGTFEKIAAGTITGGATVAEFANPVTMAAGTAGKIINKIGDKGRDIYTLDENGNPVVAKDENGKELRGDRSERAAIGAVVSGYAEQTIWTAMGLKQLGSIGVKVLDKIPGVRGIAAAGIGKIAGTAQSLAGKIATTEGGRTALKTLEVIGKVNDKLHFGSLPDMIYKSRLTELTDVLTTSAPEDMRQNLAKWVDDFTSVRGNAELLTGIIGIHLLTAGYGALKARGGERAFRHLDANGRFGGREELVAEYIGKDKAKQLSDTDLDNIYTLVTSPELSEGKVNEFLAKLNRDQQDAQKKIDAGESVASVIDGIRERAAAGTQGVKTAAERIRETLENKAKLTPQMEDALDTKIGEYTKDLGTAAETVGKMVKDDILANVKDNAVYEQPDMLDELVAMSLRKFNSEGRRLRIHDVRGEKDAGQQLRTINELGVTSWEQAEAEGLVTKDKYGRYGGGARRALNIALHGTEKLQGAVKDGKISGELAERLLTASQCELGARSAEEQAALVDGILDRAKGDEALARRMLEKLEAEEGQQADNNKLGERLDRLAAEAKVEAIKERNGTSDETARGAAVEPVETEDGQIKTVGEVVDADTSTMKKFDEFQRKLVEQTHANGGITISEFQDAINAIPKEIRKEMDNDPALMELLKRRNELYRQMGKDGGNTEENKIAFEQSQKAVVDAMNAFVKGRLKVQVETALNTDPKKGDVVRSRQVVEFSNTPKALTAVGAPNAKIISNASTVRKLNNKHGLSTEQIAELPDYYAKPVAVFRNGNDFIVLTDMQATALAGNRKPVMVYLKAQFDSGKQTFLASAYPRETSAEVEYVKLAKGGKLVFIDKERADSCGLEDATLSQLRPQDRIGPDERIIANSSAKVKMEPKPTTALGGAEQADRLAGTKLTVFNGTTMSCETFPEAKVNVSADGISVRGLTADTMAKPENVADVAAFLTHLMRVAKRNGVSIQFEDADAATIAQGLAREITEQGAAKTMAKLETRGKLFGLLMKTTLGNGVTYDEASFREALKNVSNGRQFVDNHGDVYGFVDGNGILHFNPATFKMDTPIHEYGHLALEATKKINNTLWRKGNALVKESQYYRDLLAEIERDPNSPYRNMDEEGLCDEALARLIGDRGAKLVENKGLDAQLKSWLKEVWKSFKGALGIADLTEEQIEKMTLGEFADTLNAELLKGGEFGTKKARPLEKRSIRRFDEDQNSGSNGLLRWKNDRGYLFAIPVDMERTQPGGKVVFARDDANITDWIQNALNGYTLRLSKTGKLYVEGRDGLPPELAEIFGRYPTIGQNDGIVAQITHETGHLLIIDPNRKAEALVARLHNDRASYDAWTKGLNAESERLAMEEERANAEAQARWENSGMSVADYVRSRVEEGDPAFDLDWETAREIERDRALGRFQARAKFSIAPEAKQVSEATRKEFADDPYTSKWKIRVEPEAFRQLEPRPLETVKPVSDKTDNRTVKRAIEQLFVDFGKIHNADDGTDVVFNKNDAGKIMMQSGVDMRTFAPQLKHLFETATLAFEGPQSAFRGHKFRKNVDWFKHYVNKFVYQDGKEKYIRFTVRVENNWTKQGIHAATVSDVAVYENESAEVMSFRAYKLRGVLRDFTDFILSHYIGKGKGDQQNKNFAKMSVDGQTQTRQFKEWFGKGKVVDSDGKPMVVYQSSNWDPLKEPTGKAVFNTGSGRTGWGAHFGTRKAAEERAHDAGYKNIGAYYLNLRNPLKVNDTGYWTPGDTVAAIREAGLKDFPWTENIEQIKAELRKRGYDGLMYENAVEDEGSMSYIAFEPTQIKSATDNIGTFDPANPDIRFSVGNRATNGAAQDLAFDPAMIVYNPKLQAMGQTEQGAGGIAAAIEKKEALRPWTRKDSPCDLAKPIAFDCADMVRLFRAVSGSSQNPLIRKGEHIPGRPDAIGLNRGGTRIELANKLFSMVDASDVNKLKADCASDGYFRHESQDWCATQAKDAVAAEAQRSQDELNRRTTDLIRRRVATGEGGMHYATQVLGHEIGHTIANLPADKNLGSVGNALRTLFDSMQREMKRKTDPLKQQKGEPNLTEEIDRLITWWHGADALPDYYKKPKEKFAELFGIFLTQPESVHREAPKAYDALVKMMGQNERLALAYRRITEAKWSGTSNEKVMAEVEKTWTKEQQDQFRELNKIAREPISKARDWFNYALNDRFGPMFAISQRSLAAEKKRLARAVKEGAMSEQEAADRIKAREDDLNALKTALFDWQRMTGGSTRLMMADLDDVRRAAEKDGVDWKDVRMYAHLNRVIELGGRATAHGVDPSRAAAMLGDMARRLGADKWSLVEKTWKAYRAVYERHALEDANVREMFGEETMKFLDANKHYVTMKHRMSAEESAEWLAKVKAYREGNGDAWDPTIDLWNRMNRGLKGQSGVNAGFKLHTLEGSFEATEDPIAATMMTAITLKENAARNHLLKTMSQTLRDCGVRGVYDTALEKGAQEHAVDPNVYERLTYMDGGVRHELIVPLVIGKSFTTKRAMPRAIDFIGGTMRFLRNTMTLWNPAFINRAYLIDKSSLETNIEGLHKPAIDVLSEALCFRGVGVPLYMVNNYLTRFTPIANTWVGKILWNEHTVNHYAHRAQKIARIVYEGNFGERLEEARKLREQGLTAEATEIEQNVAIAREMLKKNVFQSLYEFNVEQGGLNTDEILKKFGYRLEGGERPSSWRGRVVERVKDVAKLYNRFEEEQEAVTKIVAYLYRMKMDEQAGRTSEKDVDARARLVIEQGGTPNLSARGVLASSIENATGFFWNVRKEGFLRTVDALKDHPTEWVTKNFAQTAMPALLKGLIVTGGMELLIKKFFDDDEEKIAASWWAPAVLDHCRFVNSAMKCVPGYYQRNYNVIPLAKFGNEVLSLRVKYSPEEFAIQNAIHTAMQKFGADPTDPSADWSTLTENMMNEFLPNIFGKNYALDAIGALVGPLVGVNPYDQFRQRKIYDENLFRARAKMPGEMAKAMAKNFWNYSPLGSFVGKLNDGLERNNVNDELPGWLDGVLSTPLVKMIPASMLAITSDESYTRGLKEVDSEKRSAALVAAHEILAESIRRGSLGGFAEGMKDLPSEYRPIAVRHVLNGWRQWHMDPRAKQLKTIRSMKDSELRQRAWKMINDGAKYQD